MKVRVIHDCYLPLKPGTRPKCLEGDTGQIVDWEGEEDEPLPNCFERVDEKVRVAEDPISPPPNLMAQSRENQVMEALNRMDHEDDEQWTSQGLPQVKTVSEILAEIGYDTKTDRAEINVAIPGFARER